MFLGTSRIWWIASGVLLLLGFGLMLSSGDSTGRMVLGIVALFAAIGCFAAAPMRYGENAKLSRQQRRERDAEALAAKQAEAAGVAPAPAPLEVFEPLPPRARPSIAGRDASEV